MHTFVAAQEIWLSGATWDYDDLGSNVQADIVVATPLRAARSCTRNIILRTLTIRTPGVRITLQVKRDATETHRRASPTRLGNKHGFRRGYIDHHALHDDVSALRR